MEGPITWGAVEYFIGLVVGLFVVGGVVWRAVSGLIQKLDERQTKRMDKIESDFLAFRLDVIQNYVQHPNMEKVEKRLLEAIGTLSEQIEKLRGVLITARSRRTTTKD